MDDNIEDLANKLELYMRKIEKIEKRDVSLENSEYQLFDQLHKLKQKALGIYKKLNVPSPNESNVGKFVHYDNTPYKEFNCQLEEFVNRKQILPNIFDVKKMMKDANTKFNYDLCEKQQQKIVKTSFKKIGKLVKIRRMEQASDLMQSCGLPDCDPAESDPALQRKLMANRQMGDKNFTAIINKYADDESGDDMGGFDLLDDGSSSAANKTNSSSADEQSLNKDNFGSDSLATFHAPASSSQHISSDTSLAPKTALPSQPPFTSRVLSQTNDDSVVKNGRKIHSMYCEHCEGNVTGRIDHIKTHLQRHQKRKLKEMLPKKLPPSLEKKLLVCTYCQQTKMRTKSHHKEHEERCRIKYGAK